MSKTKCDNDCASCGIDNRTFCAVQMARANQELILSLAKRFDECQQVIGLLSGQLAPMLPTSDIPLSPSSGTLESDPAKK